MKIAVCIKRTPDSESRFKIAGGASAIDEAGLKFDMDDFAGYAIEVALQLNEKQGPGESVVYAVGPDSVQETLRKAMSMGVDRAVHLKADAPVFDGLAVSKALAVELKSGGFDLILFGKYAFDTSASIVGTATAELLGLPCVTAASKLEIATGRAASVRDLELGRRGHARQAGQLRRSPTADAGRRIECGPGRADQGGQAARQLGR